MTIALFAAAFLGFVTAVWMISVSPFLPEALRLEPLFAMTALLLIVNKRPIAYLATATCALIVGAFPLGLPPFLFFRWIAAVAVADLLLRHWLTNRSLYACVALVLAARATDMLLGWLAVAVGAWFGMTGSKSPHFAVSWMTALSDVLFVSVLFLLMIRQWRGRAVRTEGFRRTFL